MHVSVDEICRKIVFVSQKLDDVLMMLIISSSLFHLLPSTDAKADTGDRIVTSVKCIQDVYMEPAM